MVNDRTIGRHPISGLARLVFSLTGLALFGISEGTAQPAPAPKPSNDPGVEMTVTQPKIVRPGPDITPFMAARVRYKNTGKNPVVLSPFVQLQLFQGKRAIPFDSFLGYGFVSPELILGVEKRFLMVPPGMTREIEINLAENDVGNKAYGWKLNKPGNYRLEVTHHFDRKSFAETMLVAPFVDETQEEWARNPQRPWNRAIEMQRKVTVEFQVPR